MTKFYASAYLYIFFVFAFLVGLGSCQPKKTENSVIEVDHKNDSIIVWINRSKNRDLAIDERLSWLDKAHSEAYTRQEDSLKAEYFSQISLGYLNLRDSINFRETNKDAINLARFVRDSINLAEAHWDMATFFKRYAIQDSAYYHYGEAHKVYKGIGDDLFSGRMLYNMALIQSASKDNIGSEINTIRAIELLKPLKAHLYLYYCYNNLGVVNKELGEYDMALGYYDQALVYAKQIDSKNSIEKSIKNNQGNIYSEQGEYYKAIPYYKDALSQEDLITSDPLAYARALSNLAYSRAKSRDTLGVKAQFLLALKLRDSLDDIEGLSLNNYQLADFHLGIQDTVNALNYAKKAVEYSIQSENNKRLLRTYELLSMIDPANATEYAHAYIDLNDSLQMQERKIRNKFARIQFETEEFIEQNRLLAQQRQLWIGIAAGLFLLAVAILIIISQRNKNQKLRFDREQQEANQEIFNLMLSSSQKVEQGKHDEQKRISEELHDGVLGQMNGVRMVLLGLNKKADKDSVEMRSEAIEKLQDVQEEIRTISHELSDAAYQKFHNFIISIRDLVQSVSQASQIPCKFHYDHDTEWDDLSGDIKINLYRIVQEGLQNCVKYSYANVISLNFGANNSELQIRLTDDGVGFDTRKAKKGIGHKNISSRMKKIGGSWKVESSPGIGTKLMINVPYRSRRPENEIDLNEVLEKEIIE